MFRILIIIFCLSLPFAPYAQIEGDIEDQNGKGIAEALMTATDSSGKIVATVKSDKRGFYIFTGLRLGKYKIEVQAKGFKDAVFENVPVRDESTGEKKDDDMSAATRLDIVLKPLKTP